MILSKVIFEVKQNTNNTFVVISRFVLDCFGNVICKESLNYTFPGVINKTLKSNKIKVSSSNLKKVLGESLYSLIFKSKLQFPLDFFFVLNDGKLKTNKIKFYLIDYLKYRNEIKKTNFIVSELLKDRVLNNLNTSQVRLFIKDTSSFKVATKVFIDKIKNSATIEELVKI